MGTNLLDGTYPQSWLLLLALLTCVQDVLHSLSNWAARKYARRLSAAIAGAPVAPDDLLDTSANLAGVQRAQLDL